MIEQLVQSYNWTLDSKKTQAYSCNNMDKYYMPFAKWVKSELKDSILCDPLVWHTGKSKTNKNRRQIDSYQEVEERGMVD